MIIDAPSICHIPALRALWREAFGDSEDFLIAFERTAFSVDRCRCVTLDGTVVAALYWFDCSYRGGRVAYLYAIATGEAYRGRGLCRALMEDTHRHLAKLGYAGAVLVPSSKELFDFYGKMGYQICSYIAELRCPASKRGVEVRQIDTDEYARLRRVFLPADGIIQEGENLNFLQTQVAFYAGEGFLLAARCENGILYGAELLGDTAVAPAIIRALKCTEGRFRVPGIDIPFAMYYPLKDKGLVPPAYFGLAFD